MLTKSVGANPNYLATIVQLGEPIPHRNADRLQIFICGGNRVITDLSYNKGDICVFFPLESKLSGKLLSALNMYEDKNLNADNTQKGYVNSKSRVRAVKLREEPSMGLVLMLKVVESVMGDAGGVDVGTEFDTWNGTLICEKYIPACGTVPSGEVRVKGPQARVNRINRMVEGQFRLHEDTTQLRRNMHKLSPEDIISITYKMHGTSWVVGNVLTKSVLTWKDRVAKFFGVKVKETEYDYIYSSRSVIKNKFANANPNHYYGTDLWGDIKDHLRDRVPPGFTLYGEAVGFTSTNGAIQKGYDYGYRPRDKFLDIDKAASQDPYSYEEYQEGKHFGVYVYRITFTTVSGFKTELTWSQIKDFCAWFGLRHVPELFYGKAQDWGFAQEHWHENVLAKLEANYLEKDCDMCTNKVPAEGVVVRKDSLLNFEAYKLKSFRFLEGETKALDIGEIDIETQQANGDEENVAA